MNFYPPESGPQRWFFEELRYLSEQQFESRVRERPQSLASNAAGWLQVYSPSETLCAEFVYRSDFRPDHIERVLAQLTPDNLRLTILSKKCRFFVTEVTKIAICCDFFP